MQYVFSSPVAVAVVGTPPLDPLRENVEATRDFKPMQGDEMASFSRQIAHLNKQALDRHFCCHEDG